MKTGPYFNLKSKPSTALKSNVVYKFFHMMLTANATYIDMPTRYLVTRTKKHLHYYFNSAKNAISQHIFSCQNRQNCNLDDNLLKVSVLETITMKMKPNYRRRY